MKVLRILGIIVAVLLVVGLGVYGWASYAAARKLSRSYAVHTGGLPHRERTTGDRARQASDRVALCMRRMPRIGLRRRGDGRQCGYRHPPGPQPHRWQWKRHAGIHRVRLGSHRPARDQAKRQAGPDAVAGLQRHERPGAVRHRHLHPVSTRQWTSGSHHLRWGRSAKCSSPPESSHCPPTSSGRTTGPTRRHRPKPQ